MEGFGYLCGLVLAAVFVRAAAAKMARPEATGAGFRALGLPAPGVLAWVVPAAELGTAALLVAAPRAGGVTALALLALFTRVIARAAGRGVSAGCTCFGTVSSAPVSLADVVRNLAFGALAAGSLFAARPARPGPGAALAVVAAVVAGLLLVRRSRRLTSTA